MAAQYNFDFTVQPNAHFRFFRPAALLQINVYVSENAEGFARLAERPANFGREMICASTGYQQANFIFQDTGEVRYSVRNSVVVSGA